MLVWSLDWLWKLLPAFGCWYSSAGLYTTVVQLTPAFNSANYRTVCTHTFKCTYCIHNIHVITLSDLHCTLRMPLCKKCFNMVRLLVILRLTESGKSASYSSEVWVGYESDSKAMVAKIRTSYMYSVSCYSVAKSKCILCVQYASKGSPHSIHATGCPFNENGMWTAVEGWLDGCGTDPEWTFGSVP